MMLREEHDQIVNIFNSSAIGASGRVCPNPRCSRGMLTAEIVDSDNPPGWEARIWCNTCDEFIDITSEIITGGENPYGVMVEIGKAIALAAVDIEESQNEILTACAAQLYDGERQVDKPAATEFSRKIRGR